jgi:hypothetical protein
MLPERIAIVQQADKTIPVNPSCVDAPLGQHYLNEEVAGLPLGQHHLNGKLSVYPSASIT